ncbi:MAG TPA: hypothetical protein VFL93_09405 [Longimicrobiaceae bacterium]|nr:hypothetical protein [Longimicrobiaceae bacterium]
MNCGPNAAASADIVLPPTGGTITAGDATLEVPPGAVTGPTRFHLVVPAGRQFLVRASAMTANGSAVDEFNAPLTLTLHYGQHGCPRHPTTGSPKEYYSIWEVGTDGKPAKPLGGADITGKAEIQGLVGHFSGFILAQG